MIYYNDGSKVIVDGGGPEIPDLAGQAGVLLGPMAGAAARCPRVKAPNRIAVGHKSGPSPRTPVGRSGQQHHFPNPNAPHPRNAPTRIGGRDYSGHAIDRMQERGFVPSVIENTIRRGIPIPGNQPGTTIYFDIVNKVRVVVDDATGRVITVIAGLG